MKLLYPCWTKLVVVEVVVMVMVVVVVYWIHLVRPSIRLCLSLCLSVSLSVSLSVRPSNCRWYGFRSMTRVCCEISISNFICMLFFCYGQKPIDFFDVTFLDFLRILDSTFDLALNIRSKSHFHITYVYGSLLIFSNLTFKMVTWRPYWIFWYLHSVA